MHEFAMGRWALPTLFHLYLAAISRCEIPFELPSALQAALIYPGQIPFCSMREESLVEMNSYSNWRSLRGSSWLLRAFDECSRWDPHLDRGKSPICLNWRSQKQLASLVVQGGNWQRFTSSLGGAALQSTFYLTQLPEEENFVGGREILFYLSRSPDLSLRVNGAKATLFRLGDRVEIRGSVNCDLTFTLLEGEGTFMGHIMPGNRPSQQAVSSTNSPEAYDWMVFLRTVKRAVDCKVEGTLQMRD